LAPEHRHDSTFPAAALASTQLGAYELLNQIAVGEFCTVQRARSLRAATHEQVALKRLRPAHQDAYGRARLLREARVGLALSTPHLVRVLEVHDQPEPYMVMEYVPGATLRELLVRSGKIDALPFIAPVVVDVLRALSALHDHRDAQGELRPLVHQSPSARHMLVGEDGLSRLLDLAGVHRHGVGSTPEVGQRFLRGELAPEQLESRGRLDARCDLFIVGKALSEALTRAAAVRVARQGEAQVKSLCERLHAIAQRACAERREERFRSADQLACALQEAAEEADLFASPVQVAAWVQRVRGASVPPLAPPLLGQVPARPQPARPTLEHANVLPPAPIRAPVPSAPALIASPLESAALAPLPPAPSPVPPVHAPPPVSAPAPASPPAPVLAPARVAASAAPALPPPRIPPPAPPSACAPPLARGSVAPAPPPARAPVEPAPTPARASVIVPEETLLGQRSISTRSLTHSGARLGSVVAVAGVVALLTSLFTLGVRGLQHMPPTVAAARLAAEPAPALDARAPAPVVSPLAPARRPARSQSARAAHAESVRSSRSSEVAEVPLRRSTIETIAESIRAAQSRRENAGSFVRPRKLRLELPDNPY
jgi:hypothetical protein